MWTCALLAGCGTDPAGASETGGTSSGGTTGSDSQSTSTTAAETDTDGDDPYAFDPASVDEPWAARLTDQQYAYTVHDVLGIELTPEEAGTLPADIPTGRKYSTVVPTQSLTAQHVLAYADVARSVSERLDGDILDQFGDCSDPSEAACLEDFSRGLGLRLFRRPLTGEEVDRLLGLAETIAAGEYSSEADVVPGLVQAMLQMPAFLYRIERETDGEPDEVRELDGYELATRLSYFLWQSAPDAPLLAFAAGPDGDGAYDPTLLAGEVERMVGDARFDRSRAMFWGDYTMASRSSFGTTDLELAAELRDSLLLTLERLSGADGNPRPLTDLFDGETLVMTPAVAALAGVESPSPNAAAYDVSETQQRLGVVTHPAFLASIGTTSFVGRGLFLSERLLCQHVTEPPESVSDEIEDTAQATENMTPREASEFRFGVEPTCGVCHIQFEPVAYAFERYDITGRYTLQDDNGRDLYSDGVLPAFGDRQEVAFDDAPQLLNALADAPSIMRCLVHNMSEFGFGRPPLPADDWVEHATASFTDDGAEFDALVRVIALSDMFARLKVVEPG